MDELFALHSLAAFFSLTALEIVLGIDNVVFIAILSNRLPEHRRARARRIGLFLGALGRIVLLFAITWVMTLQESVLFSAFEVGFTVKDLILLVGGLFLIGKGTWEIHHTLDSVHRADQGKAAKSAGFAGVLGQIVALDIVFSIDSVLTAIGMVEQDKYSEAASWVPLTIMVTAVLVSIATMIAFSGPLSRFIQRNPTIKMLALSFLLLIGLLLVAEALHQHIPRGYIYFGMGFALFVELLNLKLIKKKSASLPGGPVVRGGAPTEGESAQDSSSQT